ncbi:hypothetical protein H5300_09815 [Vibrio sp. SG41-7]|jgi:hypothetical protein|uniref:hypothetical protein n=1 Tax=Vibrio TaxID=662 RepID=UPI0016022391|nr:MULTISPECIES: hypothetical protein [Vibrio]MBB1463609.1 hypothetical protein [Vibrio sp. SG41-7]
MTPQPIKKLTQLSALILMIFAEETRKNPDFVASGYDITQMIKELRLKFNHQQVYREINNISLLSIKRIKQTNKPDKNNFYLTDPSIEAIDNLHNHINFDPKKTSLKIFLGFQHLGAVTEAYKSMAKFTENFIEHEIQFKAKLERFGSRGEFDDAIYKLELKEHYDLIRALEQHLINISVNTLGEDKAKKYLIESANLELRPFLGLLLSK